MRVTFDGGDWIDLVARLNFAQFRRIRRADRTDATDVTAETVAAMASNWSLHDVNGAEIPYPGGDASGLPIAALDRIPFERVLETFVKCSTIISGAPDPNASPATSGGLQPAAE